MSNIGHSNLPPIGLQLGYNIYTYGIKQIFSQPHDNV